MEQGKPIDMSDADFEQEVLKSEIPVLVDFWAPWCGPCKMSDPVVEKLAEKYSGRLKVCKVNVDDQRQTAINYGIMSIPTLSIFKAGRIVDQITGVTPSFEADMKKKIEPLLE